MSERTWHLGHRPQLDAIRAAAVLLVIVAHLDVIPLVGTGGAVGVSMFFTLSGFLITTLLLEERQVYGRIAVLAFYRRRFLRLVPAMVACVILGCLVLLVNGYVFPDWTLVVGTLTYTANWVMIGDFPTPTTLGHTWSLAIEEQFYLIWPVVIIATARFARRRMIQVFALLCVAVLAWRFVLYDDGAGWSRIYFGLDTRADSLLYGAIIAFVLHRSRVRAPERTPWWVLWLGLALVGSGCLMNDGVQVRIMPTIVGIGTALVIYAISQDRGFAPFEWSWVGWIGKRSYGLYLYQAPVNMLLLLSVSSDKRVVAPLLLVGTFVVAALSFRYVEDRFLKRKDRDKRSRHALEDALDAEASGEQDAVGPSGVIGKIGIPNTDAAGEIGLPRQQH